MLTLMFWCSPLNWPTSLRMNGPSPPVKPFQKARLTLARCSPCPRRTGRHHRLTAAGARWGAGAAAAGGQQRPARPRRPAEELPPVQRPLVADAVLAHVPTFSRPGSRRGPHGRRCGGSRTRRRPRRRRGRSARSAGAGGRVQTPPQVQCAAVAAGGGRNSCSPLAGSIRWLRRSQVTGPGCRRPCRRGGAVGEGHLLAELGLAGVPDGHVREAQEVVVVQVDDARPACW